MASTKRAERANQCTIIEPTTTHISGNEFEYSLHTFPKTFQREFDHIFSKEYLVSNSSIPNPNPNPNNENLTLLAIPISIPTSLDLVMVGPDIALEKDRLLEVFKSIALSLHTSLQSQNFWLDFIDPCSALPMLTESLKLRQRYFSEVEGFQTLLGYKQMDCSGCKVLLHPRFGTKFYPGTILAHAPVSIVEELLKDSFTKIV
ncbi:hypothetical protein ScalyP_jg2462 [Parmales sp. scaly parma]|nr:hypothetical protein ScalyP_jg2462 [Parmales sp. scaly parma]